jgi:crossover junction endodeoxyribonuclease RusA
MILVLPYPPSVNHYWKHAVINNRPTVYISKEGKQFTTAVRAAVLESGYGFNPLQSRLSVSIEIYPKNKRAFDIDNSVKATLDALTKSRVWADDSQIDELHVKRMSAVKPGYCTVTITELTQQNEIETT